MPPRLYRVAVVENAINVRGRVMHGLSSRRIRKSVLPPDSTTGTSPSITSYFAPVSLDDLRAARAVVVVRVADEQDLDVAEVEAERFDALADQRQTMSRLLLMRMSPSGVAMR